MLNKAKTLKGYRLHSRDGEIGKVKDFYFDDRYWTVRYLVADTGSWIAGKQVLLSPYTIRDVNHEQKQITLDLTKQQIQDSPSLDSDKPVSKQFESDYYEYYGWPNYWAGPYMWGDYPYIDREPANWNPASLDQKPWDPHLRSIHAVTGNHIEATDGAIGHVANFLLDEDTWAIRYLIADTHNFWPNGKKVLISPQWIESVTWPEQKIYVNVSKASIKGAPVYPENTSLTRPYETELYQYYDRNGYWVDESRDAL